MAEKKRKREKYKYTEKNQLCMSKIERKKIKVEWLVISCISKNNNINKAEEAAILTSSQLFSFTLILSPLVMLKPQVVVLIVVLLLFFFFYSSLYMLTMHVCMLTHTYKRKEERERERERETKATEKKASY